MEANDLLSSQQSQLNELLIKNKELFVTKENPKLGLTNLVEHQIHLKPDAVSKHQRPYKLPPHKRDVLRHQLDELLSQGIIAPVNEKEHIPISSPIGLVSRRNRPNSGLETGSNEGSLLMSRFCVDFRYLNSNTQAFLYTIPNVDELTGSFTRHLNQYRILRLSSIRPSILDLVHLSLMDYLWVWKHHQTVFSLLKNKVLNGLSFRNTLCYLDDAWGGGGGGGFLEKFKSLKDLQEFFWRF